MTLVERLCRLCLEPEGSFAFIEITSDESERNKIKSLTGVSVKNKQMSRQM